MISTKLTDTKRITGSRADRYWDGGHKNSGKYMRFRSPVRKLPKGFSDISDLYDQQKVLNYFSLDGFEYGNWLSNDDRFNFLYGCFVSLLDIQDLTGIKPVGFGIYSIAFGARGVPGAKAHFEPFPGVINLTKEHGLNSLAHEYGHLLDHFFGAFIDQDKESQYLSFGRSAGYGVAKKSAFRKNSLRALMQELIQSIVLDEKGNSSSYYKRLTKYSKTDYTTRATEIFARTFEQWVTYKLNAKGVSNRYLSKHKYENWNYLKPDEFKKALPKMNALIKAMAIKAK